MKITYTNGVFVVKRDITLRVVLVSTNTYTKGRSTSLRLPAKAGHTHSAFSRMSETYQVSYQR